MFRLFRKKRKSGPMEDLLDLAVEDLKDKWIDYTKTFRFKNTVPLSENIYIFAQTLVGFFKERYLTLYQFSGSIFWYVVSTAILESKTHPKGNLNEAIKELEPIFSMRLK